MGIARSTYYDYPERPADNTAIVEAMFEVCDEFESYGYRRAGAALRQQVLRRPLESAQYAAEAYRHLLADAGLIGSMGRKGNPYDVSANFPAPFAVECSDA